MNALFVEGVSMMHKLKLRDADIVVDVEALLVDLQKRGKLGDIRKTFTEFGGGIELAEDLGVEVDSPHRPYDVELPLDG